MFKPVTVAAILGLFLSGAHAFATEDQLQKLYQDIAKSKLNGIARCNLTWEASDGFTDMAFVSSSESQIYPTINAGIVANTDGTFTLVVTKGKGHDELTFGKPVDIPRLQNTGIHADCFIARE